MARSRTWASLPRASHATHAALQARLAKAVVHSALVVVRQHLRQWRGEGGASALRELPGARRMQVRTAPKASPHACCANHATNACCARHLAATA